MICSVKCRRRFLLMENTRPELAQDFHNPWTRFWGAFHILKLEFDEPLEAECNYVPADDNFR
mgnify:CR=1 FL=1